MKRKSVLFVCTGNAVRSQMAEALARLDWPEILEPLSGGANPAGWVHPHAIEAMADLGIDISEAESKPAMQFRDRRLDIVVILCDSAAGLCPEWPNASAVEHSFVDDPTWAEGSEEERYRRFVACRDEIRDIITNLVEENGWGRSMP
jgi:arsenate reductase (thioredoxin)